MSNYSIAPRTPPGQERGVTKSQTIIETPSLKRLQRHRIGHKFDNSRYVGELEAQNPPKIEPCVTKGVPTRVLGHPRAPQKAALPPKGVPKSIRMACGTLWGTGRFQDGHGMLSLNREAAILRPSGRTWSLQGPILDPRGVPKKVQNRHGEARSAPLATKVGQKALPKGVPKWGRKSDRKGVPK